MGQVVRVVTIPAGQSDSDPVFTEQYRLASVYMPVSWDTAQLTFRGSFEQAGAYIPVFDRNGSEYVVVTAAGRYVSVPLLDLAGLRWLRLRSGTSDAPINQSAERQIRIMLSH